VDWNTWYVFKKSKNSSVCWIFGFYINYYLLIQLKWNLPDFLTKGFSLNIGKAFGIFKESTNLTLEITQPPFWIFFLFNIFLLLKIRFFLKVALINEGKGDLEENCLIENELKKESFLGRVYGAYRNEWENLVPFGLTLLMSYLMGHEAVFTLKFSFVYLMSRFAFHLFYFMNLSIARSLAFYVGFTNLISLMFLSSASLKVSYVN
jgi:uncharacterized MAPEG superfamily protein